MSKRTRTRTGHSNPTLERGRRIARIARKLGAFLSGRNTTIHSGERILTIDLDNVERGHSARRLKRALELARREDRKLEGS